MATSFACLPQMAAGRIPRLYDFTNGGDGSNPDSNVLIDPNGNLFGTTNAGGINGYCPGSAGWGTIREITP